MKVPLKPRYLSIAGSRWWFACLLVLGTLLLTVVLKRIETKKAIRRSDAHAATRTGVLMKQLQSAITMLADEDGLKLETFIRQQKGRLPPDVFYSTFFTGDSMSHGFAVPEVWSRHQRIVDRWDSPLNVEVILVEESRDTRLDPWHKYRVRIWSNGPNRKNDGGGADDITEPVFFISL